MLLAFLYTVADFGAVSILRMNTLTIRIYDEFIARFNKPEASLVTTSFILLFAGVFYLSRHLGRKSMVYKSNEARPLTYTPARSHPIALAGIALLLFLSIGIPLMKILWWCFLYMVDTSPLKAVWLTAKQSLFWVSITSFGIAGLMTLIATGSVFFFLAFTQRKTVLPYIPYTLALILHTLPGIVIVFGITIIQQFFDRTLLSGWLFFLSGYLFRYIGIAFVTIEPVICSISENFTRIGKVFLRSETSFMRTITFPLTKTSVMSSGTYIFFDSIRDLPIPLLLMPLGVEMLSVRIWQTASAGLYIYAAPPMVILLLLSLVPGIIYIRSSL
jgi:iron(III) transport system permease protein